jgi:gamma-glutamylcyclotransferase (GGCT)/AIG2-like uncharacterized protein YtfP
MTTLFVYGTLVPGGEAWPLLERWTIGPAVADAVPGRLFDTGRGYPAATFAPDAAELVHGVVVELDPQRREAALRALDRYEASEYDRVTVRTVAGRDTLTYEWVASLDGCIAMADGRWPVG